MHYIYNFMQRCLLCREVASDGRQADDATEEMALNERQTEHAAEDRVSSGRHAHDAAQQIECRTIQ